MFISETPLIVRYAETDQMGIVHHSNYPIWFEAGRTDFIKKLGLPYSKMEQIGIMLPLIELKCSYKGFAKYEDEILIRTSVQQLSFTRVTFHYDVLRNGNSVPITEGETMHAWTNTELKPVNMKKFQPDVFDLLNKAIT